MSDWGHDWIEKGRRFQGLTAQAKVWETTCDAGGPLMIFIPQGIGQKRFPAEQRMLPRTQDRERGAREEEAAVGEEKKRGRTLAESTR